MPQSAAMPSPFPPIADYAFLSNCHTGALVAPDGAIDWLCVPRFDSPSIFGTLLDREAGAFRFAPFGINVPSTRIYEPGTNILNTTWHTPTGWAFVRDALTIGPTLTRTRSLPHTRAPADEDAHHLLVRTVLCMEGSVDMELLCEPDFDYGRIPADWSLQDRHTADASGAGLTVRLRSSIPLGVEGQSGAGAAHAPEGGAGVLLPLLGGGARLTGGHGPGQRTHERDRRLLAHLDLQGPHARPPLPRCDPALGARDQGAHLHAHGRNGGGPDDLVAGDAGRGAQLGLPLHLDQGLDLHPPGPSLPEPGLGGQRVHAVRRRPRAERGRRAADHVWDRRSAGPDRVDSG